MKLLMLASIFYAVTILAAVIGFTAMARGGGRGMRIVFALSLAVTFVLIIVAGAVARHS